jgi:hypothetical protein
MKQFCKDIFTGKDGKGSIRAVIAFITSIAFWCSGLLDAVVVGVVVDESFYWASVTLILGLLAIRALQYVSEIRTGVHTPVQTSTTNEGSENG